MREEKLEDVRAKLPADAAILMYRVTEEGIVIFAIDRERIAAHRSIISRADLRDLVARYTREMAARADITESNRALADLLVAPVLGALASKRRIGIVPHGPLRYVAFAALPSQSEPGGDLIDRFAILIALGPQAAAEALADPLRPLRSRIIALAPAPKSGTADLPLPFHSPRTPQGIRVTLTHFCREHKSRRGDRRASRVVYPPPGSPNGTAGPFEENGPAPTGGGGSTAPAPGEGGR